MNDKESERQRTQDKELDKLRKIVEMQQKMSEFESDLESDNENVDNSGEIVTENSLLLENQLNSEPNRQESNEELNQEFNTVLNEEYSDENWQQNSGFEYTGEQSQDNDRGIYQ